MRPDGKQNQEYIHNWMQYKRKKRKNTGKLHKQINRCFNIPNGDYNGKFSKRMRWNEQGRNEYLYIIHKKDIYERHEIDEIKNIVKFL